MKILLVGPADIKDPNGNELLESYRKVIEDGARETGATFELYTTLLDEILIDVTTEELRMFDSRNGYNLNEYDVLFMRGRGIGHLVDVMGTMTLYAKKYGIKMVNEYAVIRDSSKLLQNVHFHFNGMIIPHTAYVNRGLLENKEWSNWSFPSVMKLVNGSLGRQNFVVNSWEEVYEIFSSNQNRRFILQAFIPNDGDYRLLFAGKELLVFKRISSDGSHLNNTSHGGTAEEVDAALIPSEIIEQSRIIAKQYGMEISGIDVMQDKNTGEYYFLEVNMQPQLSTGALLELKQDLLARFLKDLVN